MQDLLARAPESETLLRKVVPQEGLLRPYDEGVSPRKEERTGWPELTGAMRGSPGDVNQIG